MEVVVLKVNVDYRFDYCCDAVDGIGERRHCSNSK